MEGERVTVAEKGEAVCIRLDRGLVAFAHGANGNFLDTGLEFGGRRVTIVIWDSFTRNTLFVAVKVNFPRMFSGVLVRPACIETRPMAIGLAKTLPRSSSRFRMNSGIRSRTSIPAVRNSS